MVRGRELLRLICAIALAFSLAACGTVGMGPGRQVIEQAIVQELQQTQKSLSQQLRLGMEPPAPRISRLRIKQQEPLKIQDLPSYRVRGTYDYTTQLSSRQVTQSQNPFDLYLQRQKEGKTWRIAKPLTNEQGELEWVTQRINLF
jgi:hypothetical protein